MKFYLMLYLLCVLITHVFLVGFASFVDWENYFLWYFNEWDSEIRMFYAFLMLLLPLMMTIMVTEECGNASTAQKKSH